QALVYGLNRQLQTAYISSDLGYVRLILHGGRGSFLGREFTVLGLDGAELLLRRSSGAQARQLRDFVRDARLALAQTGNALRATAHPIEIRRAKSRGRTWALSADVQAYALGLTISFLALVLAAGSLAAERDENVAGRLARGLVSLGELVWAKVLLAALVALALGLGVSLVFGAIIQIGNVTGGEPWGRVPLLALGLLLAGGSARRSRRAARGNRPRGADGVARGAARRPTDCLPRARPAGDRPGRGLDQRRPAVHPRGALLRRRPL